MTTPRVLVAGPVSWNTMVRVDRLPEPRPHSTRALGHHDALGGTSAGKALNLAHAGAEVTLSTVVADDTPGRLVRAALRHDRITLLAETGRGATEQHLNLMDPHGGRVSIYLEVPEPPEAEVFSERVEVALDGCDVAVVDLADASRPLLARAGAAGRPVWCDIHDYDGVQAFHRPWIEAADVLFLNDDGMADPEPFMRERVAAGTGLVVCTRGAQGATAMTRTDRVHVPSAPVSRVVDTNGAGDAFFAGFLVATLEGAPLRRALEAGHRQAVATLASTGLAPRAD